MGQLALYMLALKANCEFIGGHKGDRLVSLLKRFLEDEKRAIGEGTQPARGWAHQNCGLALQASLLPSILLTSLSTWRRGPAPVAFLDQAFPALHTPPRLTGYRPLGQQHSLLLSYSSSSFC